eukprot:g39781.t1
MGKWLLEGCPFKKSTRVRVFKVRAVIPLGKEQGELGRAAIGFFQKGVEHNWGERLTLQPKPVEVSVCQLDS